MNSHVFGGGGIELVQPDVLRTNTVGSSPGVDFGRIAMFDNRWILVRRFLRRRKRPNFKHKNSADRTRLVIKRSGGDKDSLAAHLVDVRHMCRLDALGLGLGYFLSLRTAPEKHNVVEIRRRLRDGYVSGEQQPCNQKGPHDLLQGTPFQFPWVLANSPPIFAGKKVRNAVVDILVPSSYAPLSVFHPSRL